MNIEELRDQATILYHGSEKIITCPRLGAGNPHNDFGPGFYCTKRRDLADEWACKRGNNGIVNEYRLSEQGLSVFNLMDGTRTVLEWIALLLANRTFAPHGRTAQRNVDFLRECCLPVLDGYDVVVGYRADDSYFSYAEDFVSNNLSINELTAALRLGNLGMQTVLISQQAFDRLEFIQAIPASAEVYSSQYLVRETAARKAYTDGEFARKAKTSQETEEILAVDIARGGVDIHDERIPRMLP